MIKYILQGEPALKYQKRKGKGLVYDHDYQLFLNTVADLKEQHNGRELYQGPLQLIIIFYFPIPVKYRKRIPLLRHSWFSNKPEIDLCIKFVLQACHKVLYQNESHITALNVEKLYHEIPRTEIMINELDIHM